MKISPKISDSKEKKAGLQYKCKKKKLFIRQFQPFFSQNTVKSEKNWFTVKKAGLQQICKKKKKYKFTEINFF